MKTIKRYQNRKLYDTSQSQYIDLYEIQLDTFKGEKIKVIDSKTNNDITTLIQSQVLGRVLVEHGKERAKEYLNLI